MELLWSHHPAISAQTEYWYGHADLNMGGWYVDYADLNMGGWYVDRDHNTQRWKVYSSPYDKNRDNPKAYAETAEEGKELAELFRLDQEAELEWHATTGGAYCGFNAQGWEVWSVYSVSGKWLSSSSNALTARYFDTPELGMNWANKMYAQHSKINEGAEDGNIIKWIVEEPTYLLGIPQVSTPSSLFDDWVITKSYGSVDRWILRHYGDNAVIAYTETPEEAKDIAELMQSGALAEALVERLLA